MKKLSETSSGERGIICDIEGDTRFLSRITSIGPVTVLQNERKRPLLLFSRDSMIALNREECGKIMIGGTGK